jgi:hypothetical protein
VDVIPHALEQFVAGAVAVAFGAAPCPDTTLVAMAVAGGGFVPANTQFGVWLCQTRVCPTTCIPFFSPNVTNASAGAKS